MPPSLPESWLNLGVFGATIWLAGTVAVPWALKVLERLDRLEAALDRFSRVTLVTVAAMRQVDRETKEQARALLRELDENAHPRRRGDG